VVSLDAFKPEYLDSFPVPSLRALAARGVRAKWVQPAFPTLTFPNHYTIATGLYPAHHGIVSNTLLDTTRLSTNQWFVRSDTSAVRDGSWYGGEPFWITAELQGMRSGAYFFPGSEAAIKGVKPTSWKPYRRNVPPEAQVDTVLSWLGRTDSLRPRVIAVYVSLVDDSAHDAGPWGAGTRTAVARADSVVGRLVEGIRRLGVDRSTNVVVLSDHGMATTPADHRVTLNDYVNPAGLDISYLSPFFMVRPRDGSVTRTLAALRRVPHLRVYHRDSVPERWNYRGHPRILPIVGTMDDGWVLRERPVRPPTAPLQLGAHGYDNELEDMRAFFVAAGPAFKVGFVAEPFQNIHVYELICAVLGLKPAPNDGMLDSVRSMLR
jgi:predicted AlkP superfamily pyrophosphatase or phosphodiesterase